MNHLLLSLSLSFSLHFFLFPSYLFISNERMRWKVNSVCPILISRAYNLPPCWMVNAAINTTNIHTSRTNMDLPPGQQSLFSGNVHKQCYLIFEMQTHPTMVHLPTTYPAIYLISKVKQSWIFFSHFYFILFYFVLFCAKNAVRITNTVHT